MLRGLKAASGWAWEHRKKVAVVAGIALALVCPHLPAPWDGPCRVIAQAMRTWQFDGQELP